jgi:hypothetical protein
MNIILSIANYLSISEQEATTIFEKAKLGGEITSTVDEVQWFEERFKPNIVFIDEVGYTKMCVDALKILHRTAATDYGSSRQRDLGQLWADMTRGYLGEYAFQLFLNQRFGLESQLGHNIGTLEEYLHQDIHAVRKAHEDFRLPKQSVSIKTSKWNGIWLDIPGEQFQHSDLHVFIKVGTGRDHLFAFFKSISVFKDKILSKGQSVGAITAQESAEIYDGLPSFTAIPAYICGFVKRDIPYDDLPYTGKKGRKNFTITGWRGRIQQGDMDRIKNNEDISGSVKFEGIGEFSHENGYLFNTGNLLWSDTHWQSLANSL